MGWRCKSHPDIVEALVPQASGCMATIAWRPLHAYWMAWSYVGLLAAAASEVTTRVPEASFWWMVVGSSGAVILAGALVIRARMPRSLGFEKTR